MYIYANVQDRDMQNTLALIRNKVGHGHIKKFIEQELGIKYRAFVTQIRKGKVPYRVIVVLIDKLDITFDDFKDYQYNEEGTVKKVVKELEESKQTEAFKAAAEDMHIPSPQKLSSLLGHIK